MQRAVDRKQYSLSCRYDVWLARTCACRCPEILTVFWIGAQFNLFFSAYSLNYQKPLNVVSRIIDKIVAYVTLIRDPTHIRCSQRLISSALVWYFICWCCRWLHGTARIYGQWECSLSRTESLTFFCLWFDVHFATKFHLWRRRNSIKNPFRLINAGIR